jgi:hypothetical protein
MASSLLPRPRLGIADDAMLDIDETGANPRRQRQDDRSRVAAGIGQQLGIRDFTGVQFRQTVNRRTIERGVFRVFSKTIYCAILRLLQPPCAAQIDHAKALRDRLRRQLARKLMRRGKEHDVHSCILHLLPREILEWKAAVACQLGIGLAKIGAAATFAIAAHQYRLRGSGMAREQAHEFEAGISGGAKDRGL